MTHTSTEKPEALRLAEVLDALDVGAFKNSLLGKAAAELRRQHARIAELEAQLSAIGAGDVEPLRKAAATPIAWYVTGCSTMLDEHDAKAEAKRCGGSAKAVPLYTVPRGLAATQPAAQRMDAQTLKHISALSELVRMPNAEHFSDAHNAAVRHLRSLADTTAAWVRPVSELLGHISDVLPDSAFDKIDTVKWNAVSALVGATTQAAAALILAEIERMDRSFAAQAKQGGAA